MPATKQPSKPEPTPPSSPNGSTRRRDKEAARKRLDALPAVTRKKDSPLDAQQIQEITERLGNIARTAANGTSWVRYGRSAAWTMHCENRNSPTHAKASFILAVQPDQVVRAEEIAEVLWPGQAPPSHASLVHTYVARLRRTVGPASGHRRIATVRGGYRLVSDGVHLDLRRFDEDVERACRAADSDLWGAFELYGRALDGRRGQLLQDVPQLQQHPAVVRTAQWHIDVAIEFADLALRLDRPGAAVDRLTAFAYQEPLHEALQARMMPALAGVGRRAAALRLFDELRASLRSELGVCPSEDVRRARDTILAWERGRAAAPRTRVRSTGSTRYEDEPRGRTAPRTSSTAVRQPPRPVTFSAQFPLVAPPFIGRTAELKLLDDLLESRRAREGSVGMVNLHGAHEVGKSALAVRWAHRRREEFPDGQLFADPRGSTAHPVGPGEVLANFLRSLGMTDGWLPEAQEERSALLRSLVAGRRFLLVLDDAATAAQVRPLLPGTPGNLVLVTSRDPLLDLVTRAGAVPLALDVLPAPDAYELIRTCLGRERTDAEPGAASALAAVCRHSPLALRTAAARLAAAPHLSLRVLVTELARGTRKLPDRASP
ncbi:AfsR/SARP family transcriptional regulator [Streptomyces atratus]|uniref:AfsR/SARP family transcriptional regulator n=1 Tax=Streptomyces atratus TaxID=1893 RepID=UPI0033F1BE38